MSRSTIDSFNFTSGTNIFVTEIMLPKRKSLSKLLFLITNIFSKKVVTKKSVNHNFIFFPFYLFKRMRGFHYPESFI